MERRNRTIHSRMREYLYQLKRDQRLQTSILPLGDGIALSVKKQRLPKEAEEMKTKTEEAGERVASRRGG